MSRIPWVSDRYEWTVSLDWNKKKCILKLLDLRATDQGFRLIELSWDFIYGLVPFGSSHPHFILNWWGPGGPHRMSCTWVRYICVLAQRSLSFELNCMERLCDLPCGAHLWPPLTIQPRHLPPLPKCHIISGGATMGWGGAIALPLLNFFISSNRGDKKLNILMDILIWSSLPILNICFVFVCLSTTFFFTACKEWNFQSK